MVPAIHPPRLMIITVQWWILPQTKMTGSKHSDGSTTNPLIWIRWCGCETTWHDLKQRSAGQTELAYLRNSFQMTPLFQRSTDLKSKISCSKFKRRHLFISHLSRLIWSSLRKDWQYLSYSQAFALQTPRKLIGIFQSYQNLWTSKYFLRCNLRKPISIDHAKQPFSN